MSQPTRLECKNRGSAIASRWTKLVRLSCVSAVAGMLTVAASFGTAAADENEPMADCPPFSPHAGGDDGVFTTIADNFAVPRGEWWCDGSMPTGATDFSSKGLKLSIPAYTTIGSTLWTNAEVASRPMVRTGMSMSVRLAPMDLAGVQGSRGWGFWNSGFTNILGDSAMAWFMYQDGTLCPGTECPRGLFVQAQRLGNPDTKIIHLPRRLLSKAHTYTVILKENAVVFYVDGIRVARVTDPAYIPTTAMVSHLWVDNLFYSAGLAGLKQFTLAPQWNAHPTELTARWWWQGPSKRVPMGPRMISGNAEG